MRIVDFSVLMSIHEACCRGALNWSVEYSEVEDNWCFNISSPAPAECFHIKRTADFARGVERCLEHLHSLGYAP